MNRKYLGKLDFDEARKILIKRTINYDVSEKVYDLLDADSDIFKIFNTLSGDKDVIFTKTNHSEGYITYFGIKINWTICEGFNSHAPYFLEIFIKNRRS